MLSFLGGAFVGQAFDEEANEGVVGVLQYFEVSKFYPVEHRTGRVLKGEHIEKQFRNYIQIQFKVDDYYHKGWDHVSDLVSRRVLSFVFREEKIAKMHMDCLRDSLPIIYNKAELANAQVNYKLDKEGEFSFLRINDSQIIGTYWGLKGRVFKFIFGFVLFCMGLIFLYVGTVLIIHNVKEYKKTGELPPLTNKVAGLKFLFGKKYKLK